MAASLCLTTSIDIHPLALTLALLLSTHGLRKGSLSPSGSLAAFFVGYLSLANPNPTFGVVLIAFYLAGSRATKVRADLKARYEREEQEVGEGEGKKVQKHKSETGGGRDAWQVLSNGLTGCLAALLYRISLSPPLCPDSRSPLAWLPSWLSNTFATSNSSSSSLSCPLIDPWLRFLSLLSLTHYSACMGDVLASELGILSRGEPWFIFHLTRLPHRVPRGTNGAISVWGTFCSLLGGAFIGVVYLVTLHFSLPACRPTEARWAGKGKLAPSGGALSVACLAGVGGSMLDSFLGATCQRTWFHTGTRQVLVGGSLKEREGGRREVVAEKKSTEGASGGGEGEEEEDGKEGKWIVISGLDLLPNGQVNFISSAAVAVALASFDWVVTHGRF